MIGRIRQLAPGYLLEVKEPAHCLLTESGYQMVLLSHEGSGYETGSTTFDKKDFELGKEPTDDALERSARARATCEG